MKKKHFVICSLIFILVVGCEQKNRLHDNWQPFPFVKDEINYICLEPDTTSRFFCPIRKEEIRWESKDVFAPASVVRNDTLFMIYRAEDHLGYYNGTSRLGLAYSIDGYNFERYLSTPILYPSNDEYFQYEWEGGLENARIVEDDKGTYYLTYTAFNGDKARLFVASSTDLISWVKHGSVFKKYNNGELINMWSKSGAIVCRQEGERMIATKINGKYWMYWGESNMYMAQSDNLIDWRPIEDLSNKEQTFDFIRNHRTFEILFTPRARMFDSGLVEPGPSPIITSDGILMIYNGRNGLTPNAMEDPNFKKKEYSSAQGLIDKNNPTKLLYRSKEPFLRADRPEELSGQVNNVCFAQGLSFYKGKWFLYYSAADSKVGVVTSTSLLKQ